MENILSLIMELRITRRTSTQFPLRFPRILASVLLLFGVRNLLDTCDLSWSHIPPIEPDSLANLVTNLSVTKCANAESTYKALAVYAWQKLTQSSTPYSFILMAVPLMIEIIQSDLYIYVDAGHAGWLGWPANIVSAPESPLRYALTDDASLPIRPLPLSYSAAYSPRLVPTLVSVVLLPMLRTSTHSSLLQQTRSLQEMQSVSIS